MIHYISTSDHPIITYRYGGAPQTKFTPIAFSVVLMTKCVQRCNLLNRNFATRNYWITPNGGIFFTVLFVALTGPSVVINWSISLCISASTFWRVFYLARVSGYVKINYCSSFHYTQTELYLNSLVFSPINLFVFV